MANLSGDSVQVFLGNGDGTFAAAHRIASPGDPVSLAAADFNGDGRLDLAVGDIEGET